MRANRNFGDWGFQATRPEQSKKLEVATSSWGVRRAVALADISYLNQVSQERRGGLGDVKWAGRGDNLVWESKYKT